MRSYHYSPKYDERLNRENRTEIDIGLLRMWVSRLRIFFCFPFLNKINLKRSISKHDAAGVCVGDTTGNPFLVRTSWDSGHSLRQRYTSLSILKLGSFIFQFQIGSVSFQISSLNSDLKWQTFEVWRASAGAYVVFLHSLFRSPQSPVTLLGYRSFPSLTV
jgi:hypothetical protein